MNQVGLVGRVTKDPVVRKLQDQRMNVTFTLAINRNYRNNEGNIEADFILCSVWGRLAELVSRYCGKGSLIGVNGRIQTSSYINKSNERKYRTEVIVENVRFYLLKARNDSTFTQPVTDELIVTQNTALEHFVLPTEEELSSV